METPVDFMVIPLSFSFSPISVTLTVPVAALEISPA